MVNRTNNTERDDSSLLVDLSVLREWTGNDPNRIRKFLLLYQESLRQQGEVLRDLCAKGEIRIMGEIAHQLKSSSYSMGAWAMGDLCAELEKADRRNDRQAISRKMQEFESTLKTTQMQITDLLERHL